MMLLNILKILRVNQWLKNLILFFPPFLDGTLFSITHSLQPIFPFIAFCLASSATYIINDLFDKDNDKYHPEKRFRLIASGQISSTYAYIIVVVLLVPVVLISMCISTVFFVLLVIYLILSVAYSVKLKEIVLVDIFCISAGFLLRLHAGSCAYNVRVSEWLFLSVFLLSIFLSTGKRSSEKFCLEDSAHHHRKVLASYPKGFLEGSMYMTGGAVLVTYTMYVISRHSVLLLYSVPLCCFGLLRFILRIQSGKGGDPTESLLRDLPLLVVSLVWACLVGWGIYAP